MTVPMHSWAVVMPVKRLEIAKTRLSLEPTERAEVALAMAVDTAVACSQAANVSLFMAVTDDPRAAAALTAVGAIVVADEPDAGLNPALVHGAREATRIAPGTGVATIASDLPALQPDELARALVVAAAHRSAMVADASGVGTTLLAARNGADFHPMFGADSRRRHLATGATDLTDVAGVSLRRDVDTIEDLRAALGLGCGTRTRKVAARLGPAASL